MITWLPIKSTCVSNIKVSIHANVKALCFIRRTKIILKHQVKTQNIFVVMKDTMWRAKDMTTKNFQIGGKL